MRTPFLRSPLLARALLVGFITLGTLISPTTLGQPTELAHRATEARLGEAEVSVMVVRATEKGTIDPRLTSLKRQLEIMRFDGFDLLSHRHQDLSDGESMTVDVVGGSRVRVKLIDRTKAQARIRIELFRDNEQRFDSTVRINRNRTLLVGGTKQDDGVLVFPITVSY